MRTNRIVLTAVAMLLAAPLSAQTVALASAPTADTTKDSTTAKPEPKGKSAAEKRLALVHVSAIQHIRPNDQRGVNVFEAPKSDETPYQGFKLDWGAAFTQQFQHLQHYNTATPVVTNGVNTNQLIEIGSGFNNALANLILDAQLAPGIRVALETYLSARHHEDTWVKDGYLLIDGSPIDFAPLNTLMQYVTVKAGHYEVNYGDAHFRRTDNGQALFNPFVGNLLMDAFTTEIGGEVMIRDRGFFVMGGATNGESSGKVTTPNHRSPSLLAKVGFDKQLTSDLRFRLTGSTYQNRKEASNVLFSGDRSGSRYYFVMENTAATMDGNAWSGNIQPGMSNAMRAGVINPFIKYRGLEYFGNYEQAIGKKSTEAKERTMKQVSNELVYRFLPAEQVFAGYRYNRVYGTMPGVNVANEISANRSQASLGWFITPSVLLKGEYVRQTYQNFAPTDIRNGGKFQGFMMEGTVSF